MKPNLDNLFQFAAFAYVGVVALLLVGVQPFPVLHDYAEWMYQGWLLQTILAS